MSRLPDHQEPSMSLVFPTTASPSSATESTALVAAPNRNAIAAGAAAGAAWNLFGVFQFLQSLNSTQQSLVKMGMTAEQAAVYAGYPEWMTIAFAVGVGAGLAGSVLILARRASAVPVLAASLAGYVLLYIGDITEGVFAALGPPQVAILTTVVAVAVGLLMWSRHLARRGALRSGIVPAFRD
jgi:hypothetical protein